MEYIPVIMINNDLTNLPYYALPAKFHSRMYLSGDDLTWAKIESAVVEFKNVDKALKHFHNKFGSHESELEKRCFFIENDEGRSIGTAMAWYNDAFLGKSYGRLHWVAIHPEYQGRKLGKPLVSLAMECLRKLHKKAYLTTQTTSYKAINIYLNFGFKPYLDNDDSLRAWKMLADFLKHPKLAEFA